MILLDTNYLIRMLLTDSEAATRVRHWFEERRELCTSSICWTEFLSGPVDSEGVTIVAGYLDHTVIPFTAEHAEVAARLYNDTGRLRRTRIDAMIAATALATGAQLATENRSDFLPFEEFSLRLA